MIDLRNRGFESEWRFSAARSSGPGGQNVNKVNSKVELRFDIYGSERLSDEEKEIILKKLKNKITTEGELILVAQEDRSQLKNRQQVMNRFYELLEAALTPVKKRKKTAPSQASIEKRLKLKKIVGQKKELRRSTGI